MENEETVKIDEDKTVGEVEQVEETATEELTLEQKYEVLTKQFNEQSESLTELTEQAKKAEELSFNMMLKNEGLDVFADLFTVTDRNKQVKVLKEAVNAILLQNSYVPSEKAKQDDYNAAIQKGDVQGALKNKFSKLFSK